MAAIRLLLTREEKRNMATVGGKNHSDVLTTVAPTWYSLGDTQPIGNNKREPGRRIGPAR